MDTSGEILLFDLKSFDHPAKTDIKQFYNTTLKSLVAVSSQSHEYDDLVQLNALLRHLEEMKREVERLKRIREESVVSEQNPYLTVEEVAQILRVSEGTVREEIEVGKIPAKGVGKRNQKRILKSDLAKYLGVKKIIFSHSDAKPN